MEKNSIVFVPCTGNHVRRFALVLPFLPKGTEVHCISIGKFIKFGAEEGLLAASLPFERLQSMGKEECSRLLAAHKANLLVVGNDSDVISNMFVQAANEAGIPSLMMQDGAISRNVVPMRPFTIGDFHYLLRVYGISYTLQRLLARASEKATGAKKNLHVNTMGTYCTDLAVWGESFKDYFAKKGAKNIHVVGNPSFDMLPKPPRERQKREKTILFATSDIVGGRLWGREDTIAITRALVNAAESLGNVRLIIRPHPYEDASMYKEAVGSSKSAEISADGDLYPQMLGADAVITEMSTVGFEALLLGRPLAIINFTGHEISLPYPLAYVQEGAAVYMQKEADCKPLLNKLLYDKELQEKLALACEKFAKRHAYGLDGNARRRMAGLFIYLCKKRQN